MTPLSSELIGQALSTRRLGRPALVFQQVGSTNDIAGEHARGGAGDGLLVIAEEQIAGRGRLNRTWWAPPGTCLLMSLLLRPGKLSLRRAGQLTMCLGLGAVEGIEEVTEVKAQMKWPNDVVLAGRKLGGMLTELSARENELEYAVLGLGLNVNLDFRTAAAPEDVVAVATSLQAVMGREVDRLDLLAAILFHTEKWVDRLLSGLSLHESWAQRLDTLGRPVRVSLVNRQLEGTAVGVTEEGGLLVQDRSGAIQTIWSGDVMTLR